MNHFFYYFGNDVFSDENKKYRIQHRNYRSRYQDYLLENLFTIRNIGLYVDEENGESENLDLNINLPVIYNYVQSIKSSVETWFEILNPSLSKFSKDEIKLLESIYRIRKHAEYEMFLILILVFFEKTNDVPSRITLLKYIEKMTFFETLSGYFWQLGWSDDTFLRLSIELATGDINSNGVLNHLNSVWLETNAHKGLMADISDTLRTGGFYQWDGIRYFLYEYEEFLKSSSKTDRTKLTWDILNDESKSDYISVEHIYPQTARRKCWAELYSHYTPKQRSLLKNSLGNLVPLSKPKNSSLSNKCFSDKKSRDIDSVGFSFGCYSENEVALNNEWTAIEILKRGIKMARFFEVRWNLTFTNNKQLLSFLGIDFVIGKEGLNEESLLGSTKKTSGKINSLL